MPVLPLVASTTVCPRPEFASPLGVLDHTECETVLDRSERIECFDLDVKIDVGRREPTDPDDRSVADGLKDIGVFASHFGLSDGRSLVEPIARAYAAHMNIT